MNLAENNFIPQLTTEEMQTLYVQQIPLLKLTISLQWIIQYIRTLVFNLFYLLISQIKEIQCSLLAKIDCDLGYAQCKIE